MSKLDEIFDNNRIEYEGVLEPQTKLDIKVLMFDTVVEAAKASDGTAADILDKYRERVQAL